MTEDRRKQVLSEKDLAAIIEGVVSSRVVSDDVHSEHHDFISHWIEREKRKEEVYNKIKVQVGGWGIILVLSGIGYAVWEWIRSAVR
jgi:hypothetical protein